MHSLPQISFCTSVPLFKNRCRSPKPSRSMQCIAKTDEVDLVVVGAGGLGMRVARRWRALNPSSKIVCATSTNTRHAEIESEGFSPTIASELPDSAERVLFCAPPSRLSTDEYVTCVGAAASIAEKRFVFTSSTGVFAHADVVTEGSALSDTERAKRLIGAENEAVKRGNGTVLRLAGLYALDRGAHVFWLKQGELSGGPEGILNLVHYDDAAEAAVCALKGEDEDVNGKRFLVVDEEPVSRKAMLEAAIQHPEFQAFEMPRFGEGGPKKRIDGSWTRNILKWKPMYSSFAQFMEANAKLNAS